jgi:hypothetical protein
LPVLFILYEILSIRKCIVLQRTETYLDEQLIKEIVDAVPKVLLMKHVAQLCDLPYTTLFTWIKRGRKDLEEGENGSIYAKLVLAYSKKQSEALAERLALLDGCPKNYGAITWKLEKCFKKDFGNKSEAHKQLEDFVFNYLKPIVDKGGMEIAKEKIEELHQADY